jgi:hypothetical protein
VGVTSTGFGVGVSQSETRLDIEREACTCGVMRKMPRMVY